MDGDLAQAAAARQPSWPQAHEIELFQGAVQINPQCVDAWKAWSVFFLKRGKHGLVLAIVRKKSTGP